MNIMLLLLAHHANRIKFLKEDKKIRIAATRVAA
jgi:hypothetical protein